MNSTHLGADMVFAWPSAQIAVMGAQGAVEIIGNYRKKIKDSDDPETARLDCINEYEEQFNNPYRAAERGYVDDVIKPSETRIRLIDALEIMSTKRDSLPPKKHGNVPL